MTDLHWTTSLTSVAPDEVRVRGVLIDELMGRTTLGGAVGLLLTGEAPDEGTATVLEAILVAAIDHGPGTPSTLAARTSASTGAATNAAVAAGILTINDSHGGAIAGCMRFLAGAVETGAEQAVSAARDAKRRVPGFGHRLHKADPRTARLLEIAQTHGKAGAHVEAAKAVEAQLEEQTGRALPLNVDGAVAAVLADLGIPPEAGNLFFVLPRVAGLWAHVLEEQGAQRLMRRIHPTDHGYDGPGPRVLDRESTDD